MIPSRSIRSAVVVAAVALVAGACSVAAPAASPAGGGDSGPAPSMPPTTPAPLEVATPFPVDLDGVRDRLAALATSSRFRIEGTLGPRGAAAPAPMPVTGQAVVVGGMSEVELTLTGTDGTSAEAHAISGETAYWRDVDGRWIVLDLPSGHTANLATLLAEPGTLTVVSGDAAEVSLALGSHPDVGGLGCTGAAVAVPSLTAGFRTPARPGRPPSWPRPAACCAWSSR